MFGSTRKEAQQHGPAEELVREVGVQLREARLERGEALETVAENLRIRPAYLHGLEQGDLSVMPGRTYALGFLRSYAQYLGFDGDDLIVQIRSSGAGLTGRAHLHGRTPLSESRLPKLPVLVISLAAMAGIYVGWAYVDDRRPAEAELVAEVPDDLRQQAAAPLLETLRSEPAVPEAARPEAPSDVAPTIAPAAEPQADASDAEEDLPAASAQAPTALSGVDLAAATPPAATDQFHGDAPAEIAVPEPAAGAPAPATPEPAAGAAPRPAAAVLAALAPVADSGAAPTIYRTDAADTRVLLRARTSAWVHVSSIGNDYLWVKTLQPGDAFVVPDRPDLVLWTGNAGGIEVIVDGAPLPPLGPDARVVRNVPLQPQALLDRLLSRRLPARQPRSSLREPAIWR